jgi:hypothetical protein
MVDLNRDGWLDAVKTVADGPALVLEARCGANLALEVRLVDETRRNREAVGARVTVEAGGLVSERRVMAGSTSLFSDGPPVLHFGLGAAERVDRLTVRWPDGRQDEWTDLAAHQTLVLRRRPAP